MKRILDILKIKAIEWKREDEFYHLPYCNSFINKDVSNDRRVQIGSLACRKTCMYYRDFDFHKGYLICINLNRKISEKNT